VYVVGGGACVLPEVGEEGRSKDVLFEQHRKGNEGHNFFAFWEQNIPGSRNCKFQEPRLKCAGCFRKSEKSQVAKGWEKDGP
jgi:hypothetical protein